MKQIITVLWFIVSLFFIAALPFYVFYASIPIGNIVFNGGSWIVVFAEYASYLFLAFSVATAITVFIRRTVQSTSTLWLLAGIAMMILFMSLIPAVDYFQVHGSKTDPFHELHWWSSGDLELEDNFARSSVALCFAAIAVLLAATGTLFVDKRIQWADKALPVINVLIVAGITLLLSLAALAVVLIEVTDLGGVFNGNMEVVPFAAYLAAPLLALGFVGVLSRTAWGKWVSLVVTVPLLAAIPVGTAYYLWSAKVLRNEHFVKVGDSQQNAA